MTIEKGEQLSSFFDGEMDQASSEQLISELCKDQDLKTCWERYHIISDSMRSGLPDTIPESFSDNVMSAIESEPAILVPITASKKSRNQQSSPIAKKFTGFAIAASVATLAVIGVQSMYQDDAVPHLATTMPDKSEFVRIDNGQPQVATAKPVITQKSNPGFATASTVTSTTIAPNQTTASAVRSFKHPPIKHNSLPKAIDPQLYKYIVNHSQHASGNGVQDIFSPARIVTSSSTAGRK